MKTIHTVILLLFAATAFSQSYSPFYVGSWAFGPEFDYPPRILYSVRGFDNSTPPPTRSAIIASHLSNSIARVNSA